jgi:superfamily II DNA or RNA helicase
MHAIHAHWSVSEAAATIVMPTGTGKTETMLSILVTVGCPRLLVVVPTDALRTQIAEKFSTLGILKEPGCRILAASAKYPIVGILQHIPRNVAEVNDIFARSNVIVTTSSIAGQCESAAQDRMAAHCPYLFIDEAHHAEAPTWSTFRGKFAKNRVVQFTTTPFREEGKPIDGEIVFKYPLKKAQKEGYFVSIRFRPVVEFNPKRSDAKIAAKAIEQLRADADKGDIVMARVDSVARAKDVFEWILLPRLTTALMP